jgi:spermidine synthase
MVLEEVDSKINGQIKVVRSLGFGTYLQVDNLTQSGGIINAIWKGVLRKIKNQKSKVKNCLILGLGGGTVAKLINKNWPEAKITGVDLDPIMVKLGTRYLGLDTSRVKVVIADASAYRLVPNAFDIVIVDLYIGKEFPAKFTSDVFLKKLSNNKLVIFNRLYFGDKKTEDLAFSQKLKKFFSKVEVVYPVANMIIICRN